MAKVIMVQGTMSGVGKSLLTAGLCRIFSQDGYRTAPFKSQNMALNSFITKEGLEMGRAQVMQAEAAGIEPSVWMNPVLLKPTNDMGSQVIVNGVPAGTMPARDYYAFKKGLKKVVMEAYQQLDKEYDIIVIEGAGSPAELNLKQDDIVNMGLAEMVDAPVLLVGDIDRGGVFAQLIGTATLLEKEEQNRIKGLIVNKFRGDIGIFEPGIRILEEKSGISVAGVVPYMPVQLEDEDSLSERFDRKQAPGLIDIAVIQLPRISNFTDFNAFEQMEGVTLRYVKQIREFGHPDLILLPGSKNTMDDLKWLRESGLEAQIIRAARKGTVVFGICGGYQMLGRKLSDPYKTEAGGEIAGMGLLPVSTVFMEEKTRTQVTGTVCESGGSLSQIQGCEVEGYEIHMGETLSEEQLEPLLRLKIKSGTADRSFTDGTVKGNIYGTYVHGIFDKGQIRENLIRSIAQCKGISWDSQKQMDYSEWKETQYDLLAEHLRTSLDMEMIYGILGI